MNQRELSEKLDALATKLENWFADDEVPEGIIYEVMQELRTLSNQEYAPGNNTTWEAIKPKPAAKKTSFHQTGKRMPF